MHSISIKPLQLNIIREIMPTKKVIKPSIFMSYTQVENVKTRRIEHQTLFLPSDCPV